MVKRYGSCLGKKELEYETVLVDLRKQEQRTPEFLRLNPLGKVPVLVDDDEVICNSPVTDESLDDEYPATRLMPEDSQGRAQVRWFEDYCDNEFVPYTTQLLVQLRKPDAERDLAQVEQIRERLRRGLYLLRDRLDTGEFLVGGQFALADASWAPRMLVLGRLGFEFEPALASVQASVKSIRSRPSVRSLGL